MIELARSHRSQGPLAIASGSVRRLVVRTLETLGISDWFAAIVAAEDTTRHKPEPDVFLEAARRIGAETVTYVANIYKYYVAYRLVQREQEEREKEIERLRSRQKPAASTSQ